MTDTTTKTPPKRNYTKIVLMVIGLGLSILGLDRISFDIIPIGAHITASGQGIDISAIKDSIAKAERQAAEISIMGSRAVGNDQQLESWLTPVPRHVRLPKSSFLCQFFPYPGGRDYFIVTAEQGNAIKTDIINVWVDRSEYELVPL